jgi:hypothetical protein
MKKIYYTAKASIEAKEVGVKDGCRQAPVNADCFDDIVMYEKLKAFFLKPDSFKNFESLLDFELVFDRVFLRKNGKATDFISLATHLSGGEFFVSSKAKQVLDSFTLPPHNYYPAKEVITPKGNYEGYHWLHCPLFSSDYINIKNSDFVVRNRNMDLEQIKFNNYAEYNAHDKSPSATKIALHKNFSWEVDWFRVRIEAYTFISESLKYAVESNGLTGLTIGRRINIGM